LALSALLSVFVLVTCDDHSRGQVSSDGHPS